MKYRRRVYFPSGNGTVLGQKKSFRLQIKSSIIRFVWKTREGTTTTRGRKREKLEIQIFDMKKNYIHIIYDANRTHTSKYAFVCVRKQEKKSERVKNRNVERKRKGKESERRRAFRAFCV